MIRYIVNRVVDADGSVLKHKYISITPIRCDATDYHFMEELKTWPVSSADGGDDAGPVHHLRGDRCS